MQRVQNFDWSVSHDPLSASNLDKDRGRDPLSNLNIATPLKVRQLKLQWMIVRISAANSAAIKARCRTWEYH